MAKPITDPRLLLARAMKEAELQRQVEDMAHLLGYETRHIRDSRRQNVNDLPDLFLVREKPTPRAMWIELKRERVASRHADLTPGQTLMMRRMVRAGLEVYLFRPSDLFAGTILAILRGIEETP